MQLTKSTAGTWFLISIMLGLTLLMTACSDAGATVQPATTTEAPAPTAMPTEVPTPTPDLPPFISAEKLYQEREANASRYDLNYQGKQITITGLVGEIDGGEVRLIVDSASYRALGGLFLNYIALHDLPVEEQARAEKEQEFTATCRVGDYVLGTINLRECKTSVATVSQAATPDDTPVPTATPTETPVPKATHDDTPAPTATPTETPVPAATPTDVPTPTPTPEPGYGDRTWIVGAEITPGTYAAPGSDLCYWARLNGFGGSLDEIIANELGSGRQIVTIDPGDSGFSTRGCGQWVQLEEALTPLDAIPDGKWVVGTEITPGTYAAPGSDLCYWARLNGFGGSLDEIITNELGSGRQIVTIDPGDSGFSTRGCGTWTLI